jgi:pentose-5-phosphate-3-epimerase
MFLKNGLVVRVTPPANASSPVPGLNENAGAEDLTLGVALTPALSTKMGKYVLSVVVFVTLITVDGPPGPCGPWNP